MRSEIAHFADLAKGEGLNRSYVSDILRLAYLAPDITAAILAGRQPETLTLTKLLSYRTLPLDWREQSRVLGFA